MNETKRQRDRCIMALREAGCTLEGIGRLAGLTRQRVQQLVSNESARAEVAEILPTLGASRRHGGDGQGGGQEWCTTGEAAAYLRVSRYIVEDHVRRGHLPAYRLPCYKKRRMYRRADLDELPQSCAKEKAMTKERVGIQEWFRPEEAAEYLRVSVAFVYKLTQHGQLPAHRLGSKSRRYRRADLDEAPKLIQSAKNDDGGGS